MTPTHRFHTKPKDNLAENCKKKLFEIERILRSSQVLDCSLLSGKAGIALFYAYLYKYSRNETFRKKYLALINECVLNIGSINNSGSYSSGYMGVAWILAHLIRKKLLTNIGKETIKSITTNIESLIMSCFEDDNIDILNGGLGGVLYLLELRKDKSNIAKINKWIEILFSKIKTDAGLLYWENEKYGLDSGNPKFSKNMGYAHGTPGILFILLKAISEGKTTLKYLPAKIEKSIEWILKHKSPYENSLSCFPYYSSSNATLEDYKSRLGWCYGDLTIGFLLIEAGDILKNKRYLKIGNDLMKQSTTRRSIKESLVDDFALCHGTSGIGHLYNLVYSKTKDHGFKETSMYWFKETLKMPELVELKKQDNRDPSKTYGLLEGITGIGLSLISFLNWKYSSWQTCLFLE